MSITWKLLDTDIKFFHYYLDDFVPDKILDAHAHLYRVKFWKKSPNHLKVSPQDVTLAVYRQQMQWILPKREVHGIHFPYPLDNKEYGNEPNEWVADGIKKDPLARGQFMVRPTDDPEWVRDEVKKLNLVGLKPFCTYSSVKNPYQAELPDYLPEQIVNIANQEGWSITLHIVKDKGIADPANIHWIRHYCKSYPNIKLILDHCARGFNTSHPLEGLSRLKDIDNLWVDTSSVTNPFVIEVVLKTRGIKRVLYGSDYYVSHIRGTTVSVADTFLWLDENSRVFELVNTPMPPTLIGLENLLAIKQACWSQNLLDSQVEDIFWGNASELWGIKENVNTGKTMEVRL